MIIACATCSGGTRIRPCLRAHDSASDCPVGPSAAVTELCINSSAVETRSSPGKDVKHSLLALRSSIATAALISCAYAIVAASPSSNEEQIRAVVRAESTIFDKGLCGLSGCGTPTNVFGVIRCYTMTPPGELRAIVKLAAPLT
jgi:hypothetical protein